MLIESLRPFLLQRHSYLGNPISLPLCFAWGDNVGEIEGESILAFLIQLPWGPLTSKEAPHVRVQEGEGTLLESKLWTRSKSL